MNPFEFLDYLRRRWRFAAVAWTAAVAVALGASFLMPKKYTAICRIVIEPPAGTDLRATVAVSPIYLESLHTYEHFASSDSLFLRAMERFKLRESLGQKPVESIKRSVLDIEIPRNTKILEIRAKLSDARVAHDLALFIAEETVKLNRGVNQEGDEELVKAAEREYEEAKARRDRADADWSRELVRQPVDALAADIEATQEIKSRLERQLYQEDLAAAEYADREKALGGTAEAREAGLESRAARVRAENLGKRIDQLEQDIRKKERVRQERGARRERLETQRKAAQVSLDAARRRLDEARASVGYRGERLKIIDPGIVPERPSSPDIPLNFFVAWLLATVIAAAYLAVEYSYRRRGTAEEQFPLPALRRE